METLHGMAGMSHGEAGHLIQATPVQMHLCDFEGVLTTLYSLRATPTRLSPSTMSTAKLYLALITGWPHITGACAAATCSVTCSAAW